MGAFIAGAVVGALILFLVLDNNPKLAAKLGSVKKVVKEKIEEITNK